MSTLNTSWEKREAGNWSNWAEKRDVVVAYCCPPLVIIEDCQAAVANQPVAWERKVRKRLKMSHHGNYVTNATGENSIHFCAY